MKREYSAGCVVFKLAAEGPLFAFILDRFGRWTFSKGHIEEGETAFAAARRELKEEVGLAEIELTTRLGESRHSFDTEGERIDKRTEWFLVQAKPEAQLTAADTAHVKAAEWLKPYEALSRLGYTNLKPLLHLAIKVLMSLRV